MSGEDRRASMLAYLKKSEKPVSGSKLAETFGISRQVVVQDIALLRAAEHEILSTNRGYVYNTAGSIRRVFEVNHTPEEIADELYAVVDCGGKVEDIFIQHEVYGILRAELALHSRKQVREFLSEIRSGASAPLSYITSGHHFHTVSADSEETLDCIENELRELGYLVIPKK